MIDVENLIYKCWESPVTSAHGWVFYDSLPSSYGTDNVVDKPNIIYRGSHWSSIAVLTQIYSLLFSIKIEKPRN